MNARRRTRIMTGFLLVAVLAAGLVLVAVRSTSSFGKTWVTAYFSNTNGIYPGDEVRILGVAVGEIKAIEPQPLRAKVTFWVDGKYKIPADVNAVIISPSLVTSRAVQLTPVYSDGPTLKTDAVIPQDRTAVPVEWDDLRSQLEKLSTTLQPTKPGGVSTLGAFVNTTADNLRGQGASIRDTVIRLSQSLSILGDHSGDLFGTVKNLAVLVSALHDSTDLMRQLNQNFAAVTATLANEPGEVGRAVTDLNTAVGDVRGFVAENREALGTSSDKLTEIAVALGESLDDVQQALHVFPTTLSNFVNIYQPAQGGITGALSGTNFSNPINFICGAIQAASRLNMEQAAKLCVQYLAPIVKNRMYNFLGPIGANPLVGAQARPNEITYSEDWLRPDFVPPAPPEPDAQAAAPPPSTPLAAESPVPAPTSGVNTSGAVLTDPAAGLPGLMVPQGSGS